MNSNEMLDTMVNVIAEAIWQKLEPRINEKLLNVGGTEEDLKKRIESVIDEVNFEDHIDTDSITETVRENIDSEDAISDAVSDHFRRIDLKDYVADAIEDMDLAAIIRKEVRALNFTVQVE